ncbi:hypothetical protein, partial [Selenomonas sp.]|uniref:hypothetical protein n=1 Tax=Selenomonas sp. TaxID=2053611 RepID=UPI003FA25E3A
GFLTKIKAPQSKMLGRIKNRGYCFRKPPISVPLRGLYSEMKANFQEKNVISFRSRPLAGFIF